MSAGAPLLAVRVAEIRPVTPQVKRFRFVSVDGTALPFFSGGAHIMVEMRDGASVHRNSYSLMGSPDDPTSYLISVRLEPEGRGGSRFMHEQLTEGMTLTISPPVNLFPLAKLAAKHLFIAGGIGITPFLGMMEELMGVDGAPFELHYAARSQSLAAYAGVLQQRFGRHVALYVSEDGQRLSTRDLLLYQPIGTHLYVCGPERMIEDVLATARTLGWPEESLHQERFLAPPRGTPYRVELARSGKVIEVGPLQSMLEALEAAEVDAPYLCRGGACGQCETAVILCDGELLHADHFLSEAERAAKTKVMPCVSRFVGQRLVLDR
jgi:ferredoxin-NADP reductase